MTKRCRISVVCLVACFAMASQSMAAGVSFKHWLLDYIPARYPDARVIDHHYWLQAYLPNDLVVNWTEWTDADSTFKAMEAHNLTPGKAMFVEQKGPKNGWANHPAVTHFDGGGYFISGYDPATMRSWDGKGLTVIQFDGDAEVFARSIATAWAQGDSFEIWLYGFLPRQYPNARMAIHYNKWRQAFITDDIVASWEQWNAKGITLKDIEPESLDQGKAFFIEQKGPRKDWANHPAVTFYEGGGYYVSGYDQATMRGWGVEGLTVIQFDGDSKELARTIATAWARENSFENWLYRFLPKQYPNARMAIHYNKWRQAHITDDIVASWEQWNAKGITLKDIEPESLDQGKAFFIEQKGPKKDWANHPAVTYFENAGYYVSGYDQATMRGWGVEGLTVIQFDGDVEEVAQIMAAAWANRVR